MSVATFTVDHKHNKHLKVSNGNTKADSFRNSKADILSIRKEKDVYVAAQKR